MGTSAIFLASTALSPSDLPPTNFYVHGIQQNMSLAEYNTMIANAGYKSEPIGPNRFVATINEQRFTVDFCKSRVVGVLAQYNSSDWLKSMQVLESVGYKWGEPYIDHNKKTDVGWNFSNLTFVATIPAGYSYFVAPIMKGAVLNGQDFPVFQLSFQAIQNSCIVKTEIE